jgi:hypothetical protein
MRKSGNMTRNRCIHALVALCLSSQISMEPTFFELTPPFTRRAGTPKTVEKTTTFVDVKSFHKIAP